MTVSGEMRSDDRRNEHVGARARRIPAKPSRKDGKKDADPSDVSDILQAFEVNEVNDATPRGERSRSVHAGRRRQSMSGGRECPAVLGRLLIGEAIVGARAPFFSRLRTST